MDTQNPATLLQQYLQVISGNNLHNTYRDRWQFYLESYMGGEEYRQAGHLVKYQLETEREYQERLRSTPLDNHCKSVISTYISFLFRKEPDRDLEQLEYADPMLPSFLEDADLEGRSLDNFMKEVAIWANVFGHCWIIVTKPSIGAVTMADELASGVRPYVNLVTPLTVIDWQWKRSPTGYYELVYLKYVEESSEKLATYKEWTKETITTTVVNHDQKIVQEELIEVNGLGIIPAVQAYASRSPVRGIGVSAISDIADQQRAIYNEYSEVEQLVRLQNHPALVKTPDVEASAGAGAIISMPDNLDPGLKPYLLEPAGNGLSSIYASIANRIASIDKMANTGAVRATESRSMSGVAMRTEFELLNAKLSEIASNIELAEEQMWQFYSMYQGTTWEGTIEYPGSFNIQDDQAEFAKLLTAKQCATDPRVIQLIDHEVVELLGEDPKLILPEGEYGNLDQLPEAVPFEPHIMVDPATGQEYIASSEQEHQAYAALGYVHKMEEY